MAPPRKYSPELRERAVRMVFELREQTGVRTGTIARVTDRLGVHREALRTWIRQAEVDGGKRPGTTSSDSVPPPRMDAICERVFGTLRREVVDRVLISANATWRCSSAST